MPNKLIALVYVREVIKSKVTPLQIVYSAS